MREEGGMDVGPRLCSSSGSRILSSNFQETRNTKHTTSVGEGRGHGGQCLQRLDRKLDLGLVSKLNFP